MATNLSNYFRQKRIRLGLRLGDLVRKMGYRSIAGAANKIVMFEERGDIQSDLFQKLATALEIDKLTIQRLIEQDRREFAQRWNDWANQPIEPHLVFRAIPGVYFEQGIADSVKTRKAMEEYAAAFAKDRHMKVWLVLSRRLTIHFDENGVKKFVHESVPGELNTPSMHIAGDSQKFRFTNGMAMRPLNEPEQHEPK